MKPMASKQRTSKKEHKKRQLPLKLRDLPDADVYFGVIHLDGAAVATSVASGPSQDGNIPVDDSADYSTSPTQSQDSSSSDEETARVDPNAAATQFYTGELPTPGLHGNFDYRCIIPRQAHPVIDNQSGGRSHTSTPSYHLASGPSQDGNIPVDDLADYSTQSQDSSSSDEETAKVDPNAAATQFYTGELPTPGLQGNFEYRCITPRQAHPVIDNQSGGLPPNTTVLNQNQGHHLWPVQMASMHYQPNVQGPPHLVGIPPWGSHTFFPEHNTFFVAHDAYPGSTQIDYATYPTHNQGQWTGPSQDDSVSGSG